MVVVAKRNKFKFGKKKIIGSVLSIAFLLGALVIGVTLTQQRQELRKMAADTENEGEEVKIAEMADYPISNWNTVKFNQAGKVEISYWKLKYPSINAYSAGAVKADWWREGQLVTFYLKESYQGYALWGSNAWIGDELKYAVGNWNKRNQFFYPRGFRPVTTKDGRKWCNRVDVTNRLLSITNRGHKIAEAHCWEAGAGWFFPLPNVADYSDFLVVFSTGDSLW